ncbi:hypothetical protein AVEN_253168-1 [Araneus ventricosus]|uniref:Uncharacterized protein n=1 Tax=Araneus ventricosus TaxID=182803 RepID=A0A4Y2HR39_ARAVE|nr:hypothetical protein AVEN_253168-1 [Araneus ventricosus]
MTLRACLPIHLSHLSRYSFNRSTTVNLSLFSCHNVPLCSVPVFQLTLPHQLLLHETRPIFTTETYCISLIAISTSEIHLPHVYHASRHASCGACSPN